MHILFSVCNNDFRSQACVKSERSCTLLPICHRSLIQLKGMHNALNRATPREQRYNGHKEVFRLPDSFQCCPSSLIKCLFAHITSVSPSTRIMDHYIPLPDFPS